MISFSEPARGGGGGGVGKISLPPGPKNVGGPPAKGSEPGVKKPPGIGGSGKFGSKPGKASIPTNGSRIGSRKSTSLLLLPFKRRPKSPPVRPTNESVGAVPKNGGGLKVRPSHGPPLWRQLFSAEKSAIESESSPSMPFTVSGKSRFFGPSSERFHSLKSMAFTTPSLLPSRGAQRSASPLPSKQSIAYPMVRSETSIESFFSSSMQKSPNHPQNNPSSFFSSSSSPPNFNQSMNPLSGGISSSSSVSSSSMAESSSSASSPSNPSSLPLRGSPDSKPSRKSFGSNAGKARPVGSSFFSLHNFSHSSSCFSR